ncbi:MAG: C4-type zinc ribbon domain-containing protein [Verrucomicrobiales bacterium]|jgi:predicted  nucleic acid-binding Zn-ribbon protein|nr:C4-type zinc ribbon domain-containing protein [Verrucomicrobiales bacterium]
MLATLEQLLILQERDVKLQRAQTALHFLPVEEQQIAARLATQSARFEQLKQDARHIESERKQLELQVADKETAIRKFQTHQAQTKKNDEYQAMSHEIDRARRDIDALEERELALMDQYDAAQKAVQAEALTVKEHERVAAGQRAEWQRKQAVLQEQAATLTAAVAELQRQIPPAELAAYRRILQSKGDVAIVPVVNGNTCNGCHMKITQATVSAVKAGGKIVHCDNCGRIVYWPQP